MVTIKGNPWLASLLLILPFWGCSPELTVQFADSENWYEVQNGIPTGLDSLVQHYLDYLATDANGAFIYHNYNLANSKIQHPAASYTIVKAYFEDHSNCSGVLELGDNAIPCNRFNNGYEAKYPSPLMDVNHLTGATGSDWPVYAESGSGDVLIDADFYVPLSINMQEYPIQSLNSSGNLFRWIADPNNAIGMVVILDYNPATQHIFDPIIAENNPNRLTKIKSIDDVGLLSLDGEDFNGFPDGSIIKIQFIRGNYNKVEVGPSLYQVVFVSSWHLEIPINR